MVVVLETGGARKPFRKKAVRNLVDQLECCDAAGRFPSHFHEGRNFNASPFGAAAAAEALPLCGMQFSNLNVTNRCESISLWSWFRNMC